MVDRGANGGIAGRDARVINHYTPPKCIDLSGIDNHTLRNVELVIAAGVVRTNHGNVLVIMNHYAHMPDGKTMHSCGQMEWNALTVNEKSPNTPSTRGAL